MGKHVLEIPIDNLEPLLLCGMISVVFLGASQCWSKTAFAFTMLRISTGKLRYFIWFIIISINLLGGLGCMFYFIDCTPIQKAWQPSIPGTCWDPSIALNYAMVISGKLFVVIHPLTDHLY
jgi:hypothetical protein